MCLARLSQQVVTLLARNQAKLVLSESCTAGLISATLGGVSGVSQYLCGSAVVYREQTKVEWLNVSPETLADHTAVSRQASEEIAMGVLCRTSEADWSLGITGHLGPGSPPGQDGHIHLACCHRSGDDVELVRCDALQLKTESRLDRQREATELALRCLVEHLTVPH